MEAIESGESFGQFLLRVGRKRKQDYGLPVWFAIVVQLVPFIALFALLGGTLLWGWTGALVPLCGAFTIYTVYFFWTYPELVLTVLLPLAIWFWVGFVMPGLWFAVGLGVWFAWTVMMIRGEAFALYTWDAWDLSEKLMEKSAWYRSWVGRVRQYDKRRLEREFLEHQEQMRAEVARFSGIPEEYL